MRSGGIELLNLDCLDLLKSLPDASVDLMLTDPPYATTQNGWDKPINLAEMWLEWERVVKPICKIKHRWIFSINGKVEKWSKNQIRPHLILDDDPIQICQVKDLPF